MYRLALDVLGGQYRDARLIATVGAPLGTTVPERWRRHLERISIRFVAEDPSGLYRTQGFGRWNAIPPDSDIVVFADADTLPLQRFDEVLDRVIDEDAIAGTIAHVPLVIRNEQDPAEGWTRLAQAMYGGPISLDFGTTLPEHEARPVPTPFYVNYGAVFMTMHIADALRQPFLDYATRVEFELVTPYYAGQAALALAVASTGVPRIALDLRYNFPNDTRAEELYPAAAADIRIIHYLRTNAFDRQCIFADPNAYDAFLALHLSGSNADLQQQIGRLTGGVYPFR